MAAPNLDIERAAEVLLDAAFMSDREAAKKHGISRQTVLNYRRRLDPQHKTFTPELLQLLTQRLNSLKNDTDWEARLPGTLKAALEKMESCFSELNPKSPESLRAITDAVTVMVEALMTLRMLDARLAHQDQSQTSADRQVFTAPHGQA